MVEDIYDPLDDYVSIYRDKFSQVAESTFAEMAEEAKVDVEANKATCKKLYAAERELSSLEKRLRGWKAWRVFLWVVIAGLIVAAVLLATNEEPVWTAGLGAGAIVVALYMWLRVRPKILALESERDKLSATVAKFKDEAWAQMEPLNRLYDWDILTRMMSRTVPRLEFDPYFTTQRLADLEKSYGWDGSFNAERSVLYSISGLINGNPFVICRTKKMEMGTKTYYGHKTIYWTTTERGSDGKTYTRTHSQTLTATVDAPYPEYFEKTRLIYGNTAAPDLVFHRASSGLAGSEGSWAFRRKRRSLRRKARNLKKSDYAMMSNEEFEVAFDTSDRNDNQQLALLFTPLAQQSMLKLLRDRTVGFGDDFDFDKERMINVVRSRHMQDIVLDMNPDRFRSFDFAKAKEDFVSVNAGYFKAIYFNFAPLLCVPLYQQTRSYQDIYGREMPMHSSFWEHEALANFWGAGRFMDPACVTDCILKTEEEDGAAGQQSIRVYAHGYRSEQRLTYVGVWGGDGRRHEVPVYWDEYLPVTGTGSMRIHEDNTAEAENATCRQRLDHIADVLGKTGLEKYRKHIASEA